MTRTQPAGGGLNSTLHLRAGDALVIDNDSAADAIVRYATRTGRGRVVCYPGERWILSNVGPYEDLRAARRLLADELARFGRPRLSVLRAALDHLRTWA